jgi:hypothetical protein
MCCLGILSARSLDVVPPIPSAAGYLWLGAYGFLGYYLFMRYKEFQRKFNFGRKAFITSIIGNAILVLTANLSVLSIDFDGSCDCNPCRI